MRRNFGITLLAFSVIAGGLLALTGNLGTEEPAIVKSGPGWRVAEVEVSLNWFLVIPLLVCLAAGILCLIFPRKTASDGDTHGEK